MITTVTYTFAFKHQRVILQVEHQTIRFYNLQIFFSACTFSADILVNHDDAFQP